MAAPSPFCGPFNVSVAHGGSIVIDASACDGPDDFGIGLLEVAPAHGTATINTLAQTVTYAHAGGGDTATSDTFVFDDGLNNEVTVNVTIGAASPITISPGTLSMTAGTPFSQQLTAAGGTAPYTWTLDSGTLPAGISFSASGLLSGTPTARGNHTFTVLATDNTSLTAAKAYTLTVGNPTLSLSPANPTAAVNGVAYSFTFTPVGGVAPYTLAHEVVSGSLPPGLSLSGATLSGTPTALGSYTFGIRVTDSSTGPGTYFEVETVTLVVNPPPTIAVNPTTVPAATVGSAYSQTITGSGGTASYTFAITAGALPAGLSLSSAGALSGTPTAGGTFNFTVTATDANGFTGSRAYTLTVNAPTISVTPTTLPAGSVAAAYSQTINASGGTAPYTRAITAGALPAGLSLSSAGALSGTPTAGGTFNFTVTATDSSTGTGSYTGSRAYSLTINAATVVLPATTLANGTVATPYSVTLNPASGGTAPYTYALTAGALPTGISLSSAGALSGTPTANGTFNFSVTATDSSTGTGPYTATRSYSLTIAELAPVANAVSATVAYGSAANPIALNITGGTPTSVAVATAPAQGVAIASGLSITYQPNAGYAGVDSFTYTATNGAGTSAPATVTITVNNPTITVTASGTLTAQAGTPYSQTFTWNGGTAPYSGYSVSGLPAGLSITSTTTNSVTVSGTPTATGSFPLNASATDSSTGNGPFTQAQAFTLTVGAPTLSLTPAAGTLTVAYGSPYSQSITASGGTAPYSYALTAGALPPGISFSSAGVLSGMPTVPGTYSITLQATDSSTGAGAPYSVSANYVLEVGAPTIAINPATLPNPVSGVAYSQTVTASGGVAPYTFALPAGALPAGMSFSSAGVLSGTPVTSGTFNFTVSAQDANGQSGTRAYSITIDAPTLVLTPSALPAGSPGVAYSQSFSTSGGIAPYSYALESGALPPGISFTSAGLLSGTPTVAGTFNFVVRSTDSSSGTPATTTVSYSLAIVAPTIVVDPASLPDPAVGAAYSQTITASGGTAPYAFSLGSGALPAGMSFSSAGVLSGTPVASGAFNFTVIAQDANGQPGSRAYSVTIAVPSLTLTPATLPAGTPGVAYSQSFSTSGGTAPYSYALDSGALPTGLSFTSAGVLSGTPTAAGTFNFVIRSTDSTGGTAGSTTVSYSLTIGTPTITVAPASLPAGGVGTPYAANLSASGGTAPYSYALGSGGLPPGVSFSSAGAFSGTPTTPGNYSFTVDATDSLGFSGSRSYTIAIADTAPVAVADSATTLAQQPVTIAVTDNDSGVISTVAIASGPAHGTAAVSGTSIVYTPATGYSGADSLSYTAIGPGGSSAPAVVSITVTPLAVPQGQPQTVTTLAGQAITIDATLGASGGPFTGISIVTAPSVGTAVVDGTNIVYTPPADASGSIAIGYTLSNAFGASAPITATVTVNPLPVAVSRQVSAIAGTPVVVDLTAGASGGPFTAATLVSVLPTAAGTASIAGSGGTYELTFTPAASFTGLATVTFTLANAFATSAPATIDIDVTIRPDPTLDAEVMGVLGAQASATRRFATAQIGNFQQRMENLHSGNDGERFQNRLTFATDPACNDDTRRTLDSHCPVRDEAAPVAAPATAEAVTGDSYAIWTGGSINSGDRDGRAGSSGFDFETTGVSLGADYRINPAFVLGGGIGYGRDDSDIGENGSRSDADSLTLAVYGSYHPGEIFFIDGLFGYQRLSFDSRRYIAANGGQVSGERDGKQWLLSLSAGGDYRRDRLHVSPYARFDLARATLDGYTEQGDAVYALRYEDQDVDTSTASLGLRLDYRYPVSLGTFSPQLRLEYQHDFQDDGSATMSYADLPGGPFYRADVQGLERNRFVLGLGAILHTERDLTLRFEYRGMFGSGDDTDHGVLLNLEKTY